MALLIGEWVFECVYADDPIDNCDRSEQLELEGSIESMPPDPKHSGFMSTSGDLPTPPFGQPCLEKVLYLGKLPHPQVNKSPPRRGL